MTFYALRHIQSQKFLILDTSPEFHDGLYGQEIQDIEHSLVLEQDSEQVVWTVRSLELATFVRSVSARDAYCSSPQYPVHSFQPEELEVVDLETGKVLTVPTLPSELEIFDVLTSISHYSSEERIEELRRSRTYSWGDYQRYLKKLESY